MSAGIFLLQRAELCRKHAEHDFRVHLRAKALDGGIGQGALLNGHYFAQEYDFSW